METFKQDMVDMVVPCESVIHDYAKELVLLDLLNSVSVKFHIESGDGLLSDRVYQHTLGLGLVVIHFSASIHDHLQR